MSNKNKAYLRGIYETLVNALDSSFDNIPEEIFENIETITDPNILQELVNHLIKHNDLEKFFEFLVSFAKEEIEEEKSETDDYDSPWKEALEKYFPQCMQFFFPEAHKEIDWGKGFEFLDKELQQVTRDATIGRKYVDKLFKVWLKNGKEAHALIHIDVQSQYETDFSERMYIYNYRLFDRYKIFVASFAILGDTSKTWNPKSFEKQRMGCKLKFQFPTVKLSKYEDKNKWKDLENSSNPFAIVVMAHIKTKSTANDDERRVQEKLYIMKHLFKKGFQKEDIENLLKFIDWIMHVSEDHDKLFWQEIEKYQKEEEMPYVNTFERIGYKRGYDEASKAAAKEVAEVSKAAAKEVAEVSKAAAKEVAEATRQTKQTTAALLAKLIAKKFNTKENQEIPLLYKLNQDDILELGENIIIMDSLGEIHNWINQKVK